MRLSLIDLLVVCGLSALGAGVSFPLASYLHIGDSPLFALFAFALAALCILLFASPIYRVFHFRPLFVPRCPHCHRRPDHYRTTGDGHSRELIACGLCGGTSRVWYGLGAPPAEIPATLPLLRTRWPYFVGGWQLVTEFLSDTKSNEPNA